MVIKKNIAFVIPSLGAGGGEKSLVNLLNVVDYSKYNVDLILLHKVGLFLNMLPPNVTILEVEGNDYQIFTKGLIKSILSSLIKGKIKLAFHRILFAIKNNVINNKAVAEQISWTNLQNSIPRFQKQYDVAIGFLEKTSIYIATEKINALKKIGFIHNDYDQLGLDPKKDFSFFKKLDKIVTVSEKCENVLKSKFPSLSNKINIIYNIVSTNLINKLAESQIPTEMDSNAICIISIGRLHPQKGFDLAIESCFILKKRGYNVKWYIIGDGNERNSLTTKIKKLGLENYFLLLGLRENPYPYVKKANIYCQTSRFEGKSIAIDEAKILKKVIVTTNFTTVKDQINHEVNGIVCNMDANSIAENLIRVINNKQKQNEIIKNLSSECLGTESEINKLYKLFEN